MFDGLLDDVITERYMKRHPVSGKKLDQRLKLYKKIVALRIVGASGILMWVFTYITVSASVAINLGAGLLFAGFLMLLAYVFGSYFVHEHLVDATEERP